MAIFPLPVRFGLVAGFLVGALAISPISAIADEGAIRAWQADYQDNIRSILVDRCLSCHGAGDKNQADFNLADIETGQQAFEKLDFWERVAKRVRVNEMPPPGSPGLNDDQKGKFLGWLDNIPKPKNDNCDQLATDTTVAWYQGYVLSRRLTKAEYSNAVRDLLGYDYQAGADIPVDGAGGIGFDTAGDTLFTSTIHIEKYLAAADRVIETILADNPSSLSPAEQEARQAILQVSETDPAKRRQAGRAIVTRFARKAWRRPPESEEVERLLVLYDKVAKKNAVRHLSGIRQMLKGVMVSPHFLFVVETQSGDGGVQRLTPHQLATRLALFIWSSIPDEQLLELADSGKLYEEPVLRSEVQRMLKDSRARALGENFGLQWLGLSNFDSVVKPDATKFPEFVAELRSAMREEVVQFVSGVFREDRSLLDLVNADYTYANEHLAQYYGLGWNASESGGWQQVSLANQPRGGVLTMGAVLTATSYPLRTSPVLRGRWVLEEIMGDHVPPPPPNVPALDEQPAEKKVLTLRERLELHRQNPECAACHSRMDPLGFGLENFDAIGRYRTDEDGKPIDSAGILPSGESFAGILEMKQILLNRKENFLHHMTRKLLGFALGRNLTKFDDCVIDRAKEKCRSNGFQAKYLIEEIAVSYPFQHRFYSNSK